MCPSEILVERVLCFNVAIKVEVYLSIRFFFLSRRVLFSHTYFTSELVNVNVNVNSTNAD